MEVFACGLKENTNTGNASSYVLCKRLHASYMIYTVTFFPLFYYGFSVYNWIKRIHLQCRHKFPIKGYQELQMDIKGRLFS